MRTYLPKKHRYPVNYLIIGWFAGFGLSIYYMTKTFVTIDAAFHLLLLIAILATAIHALLFGIRHRKELTELLFYNLVSNGLLGLGLMLLLNYHLAGNPHGEYHALTKDRHKAFSTFEDLRLEDGAYRYFGYVLNLDDPQETGLMEAEAVELEVADGLFGFKVLKGKRFIDLRKKNDP
ncbi:MAG: hypothetical protein WD077_13865 [Bacteroidia bacterium]